MYRPEGWTKRLESWFKRHPDDNIERVVYEAGGDAMLEGLKKQGTHTNVIDDGFDIKGWRVFIPEEDNEK